MRWQGRRGSENVEDRRRIGRPAAMAGGGIGMAIIALVVILLGGDPEALLQGPGLQGGGPVQSGGAIDPAEDELAQMVSVVLADTEEVWHAVFRSMGRTYREPKLVLFKGRVESACGMGSAASGPFYCPGDDQVYIDLVFYQELRSRFRAPGDFAQAYVIAHEVGHHVQNLLGMSDQVHRLRGRVSQEEYNQASVRLELQADFFAGLWAHHAQKSWDILEPGDIEEALRAASAIGDDAIQMQSQGHVVPDSFTHGTSEQRVRWFRKGLETGDFSQGDTFRMPDP